MEFSTSGILDKIKSGGFQNPVRNAVGARLSALTIPSLSELSAMADAQAAIQNVPAPSPLQLETALNSIQNAVAKTNDLLGHTDRISGVDLSGSGSLATIAKTMQSAKSLNGEKSCSTVLGAFGAIQKAAELVSDTVDTINLIESFKNDIIGQVNAIPQQMINYTDKITHQITSDVGYVVQAKLDLLQNAVASSLTSLFQDECVSQVLSAVMTQPLKNEVTKVMDDIKYKKLVSIKGK